MGNRKNDANKVTQRTAPTPPKALDDGQLDQAAGGARPVSGHPIIIVGG